jgi:hypothetical protein
VLAHLINTAFGLKIASSSHQPAASKKDITAIAEAVQEHTM